MILESKIYLGCGVDNRSFIDLGLIVIKTTFGIENRLSKQRALVNAAIIRISFLLFSNYELLKMRGTLPNGGECQDERIRVSVVPCVRAGCWDDRF